jgi:hypothetical protein
MDDNTVIPKSNVSPQVIGQVQAALSELDREYVEVNGSMLKPSQCYRFGLNPPFVLFNTDCPEQLKEKVQSILSTFIKSGNESR